MEFLIISLILLAIYFMPTFIALRRRHTYKWVILGINTFAIAGGIPWLVAFIGSMPTNKSFIDPIAGNVTGKGTRNFGDTVGSIEYGRERGYEEERKKVRKINLVNYRVYAFDYFRSKLHLQSNFFE